MQKTSNFNAEQIKLAAKKLRAGNLVAFPTETVYGLGADALNKEAVAKIYEVKGRPIGHPLIVHISSLSQLNNWVTTIPDYAWTLARNFWPGPMTLILPRSDLAKNFITGDQETVGLRVPAHKIAVQLLEEFEKLGGSGVAAPSANIFGAVSPTTSQSVYSEIGSRLDKNDLILDGGSCQIGIESTIIDCTQEFPNILRPGAITIEMCNEVSDINFYNHGSFTDQKFPGSLKSHYSPIAKVLIGDFATVGDGFIALSSIPTPPGAIRLSSPKTVAEFANSLYEAFRFGDKIKLERIVVVNPPNHGLGSAIRDRISKAASGKF